MKQLRAFVALLTLVSLASFSPVKAQDFEVPLTVTDGASTYVVYVGVLATANYCIVPADVFNTHAESMLPPPPPGGVFDARVVWARAGSNAACFDQGSSVDFRPFTSAAQKDTFKVKTQLGTGSLITLSWSPADVAHFGTITLRYVGDSGPNNIDMHASTSTTFPDASSGDPGQFSIYTNGIVVPPPVFGVAPTNIPFGNVGNGSSKVDSVTVSNNGSGILNITAVNSSNPLFTVTPAAPQAISVGSPVKFYITYSPLVSGHHTANISFTHDAAGSPGIVTVDGDGVSLPLSFTGLLTVGDPTAAGRPNTSYGLRIGFDASAQFCIGSETIGGFGEAFLPPPPPGGVFDARMVWPRAGSNAVCFDQGTLNDFREFQYAKKDTFKLKAQLGSGPNIAVSWSAVDFSAAHFASAHFKFNDGSSNIDIDMLTTFSADLTGASDPVTATIITQLKIDLPPDTNRTFSMAPLSLAFGSVGTCASGLDSVVVSNVAGSSPLVISAVNSSNPRFTVLPAAPQSIPSGGSMKFYVTFTPIAVGAQSGTVTFVNNGNLAPATTNVLSVNGTGFICPPNFVVAPNPLHFGLIPLSSCPPGDTKIDSVVVTNNGTSTMVISAVNSSNPLYSVNPTSGSVPASGGTMKFYVTAGPTAVFQCPSSTTISFVYTGPSGSPGTLSADACFSCTEPKFVTVTPDSMTKLSGFFFQRPAYRTRPNKSFPNWSNLMQEVVVQGGFQPGGSESDIAGGLRIGQSFMRALSTTFGTYYLPRPIRSDTAWVRLTGWIPARGTHPALGYNWGALQGTLKSRTGFPPVITTHDNYARGLDSTLNPGDLHRQLMRGQAYQIYPYRSKNKLFAEVTALKFNIAANDLGKAGSLDSYGRFGGLIIGLPGNPLDGKTIRAASALIDSFMTFERNAPTATWFDDAYACVYAINRAFVGALDTTYNPLPPFLQGGSFYSGNSLHINGVAGASATGGLLTLGAARPEMLIPTNDLTEGEYGFDGEYVDAGYSDLVAADMKLFANYPNPFNPTTNIAFHLSMPSQITVKVYNLLGQEIATLLNNEPLADGYQSFMFDAHGLASGVYYYIVTGQDLESGSALPRSIGKMLLVK